MSEELKPCEHGRNFCMDCHYPKGKFKTLPAMYDGLAAENQRLRTELAALKASQGEPVMWVNPNVIGADQKINWPTAITFSNRGPLHGWTFPLYAAPPASADARLVPVELLERICRELERGIGPSPKNRAQELRALLAQSESKVVKL